MWCTSLRQAREGLPLPGWAGPTEAEPAGGRRPGDTNQLERGAGSVVHTAPADPAGVSPRGPGFVPPGWAQLTEADPGT